MNKMNWTIYGIECVTAIILFTGAVITSLCKNPVWWIHDYPKDIQDKYFETHEHIPVKVMTAPVMLKKGVALLLSTAVLILLIWIAGASSFMTAFLASYGLWLVIDWYDCFFLDWVLFANVKRIRLPGTEHMERAYHQKKYHFNRSLIGMALGLLPCLLCAMAVKIMPMASRTETVHAETLEIVPSVEQARELMEALNNIDRLGASAIPFDEKDVFEAQGTMYYRILSPMFQSTADVRSYMNEYMTDAWIKERYSSILEAEEPVCIDVDGALYISNRAKAGGFAFSENDPMIVKDDDGQYEILAEFDNYGMGATMHISLKYVEGVWKIDGMKTG